MNAPIPKFDLPFDPMALNRFSADSPIFLEEKHLPVLITGVAGVVGFNLYAHLQHKYPGQVFGVRPVKNWRLTGPGILSADMDNQEEVEKLLKTHRFGSIVSCGGSCALKSCELDPEMANRVNVQSVRSFFDSPYTQDTRIVHLSIDLVYSGDGNGNHIETDTPDPVTVYGKTMVTAEKEIQKLRPDSPILRISLPMGISFNGHAGAVDWIQYRFKNGRPATLYYDEIRTPTYSSCMNTLLEQVIASDMSGIYHTGGTRKLSLYQIAQIINLVGGYDPDLLIGCPRIDAGPMPPRAGDVTMDSSKIQLWANETLSLPMPFQPWPLNEQFVPTDKKWHYHRKPFTDLNPERIAKELYCLPGTY